MTEKVFVGFVHDNEVTYSWHFSFLEQIGWDLANKGTIVNGGWLGMRCGTDGVAGARNKVVREFLRTDADWLWWVDTDMGYGPDTVEQLLAVADPEKRPIVGGLCFAMRGDRLDGYGGNVTRPVPVIYDWAKEGDEQGFVPRYDYPRNAVIQCSATGSACVLIHRSVFEKIAERFMPICWYDRHVLTPGSATEDAVVVAEDLSFCMRAAAVGCPTFVHTGVKTTHMKPVWLGEDQYLAAAWPEPATDPVAVIVPVLTRPQNVRPLLESLRASTGLATAYFVTETGDLDEQTEVLKHGGRILECDGTFARKANHGYRATTEPWVLLVGDDVIFRPGWYDRALRAAGDRYHLVGTNDLSNLERPHLAVHPLIRRSWAEEHGASWDGPGTVAHEGYGHCFVDNEWSTVAAQAGVFIQAPDAVIEHLHPIFHKAGVDAIYEQGQKSYDADRLLFDRRAAEHANPTAGFSIAASVAAYQRQWQTIPGMVKVAEDLARYEKILADTTPDVVVECGTWTGRAATWFADHDVDVLTIDIDDQRTVEAHPRVTFLAGSSTDPHIVEQVRQLTTGRRTMVVLDSDHAAPHVAAELEAYAPLVTPGCYLVVEDGICRHVPGTPATEFGPLDAIESFLPRPGWEHDDDLLDLYPVSHHPSGWLRKAIA